MRPIVDIKYAADDADRECRRISITDDLGRTFIHPFDAATPDEVEPIKTWLDAGNEIAPYVKPLDQYQLEKHFEIYKEFKALEDTTVTLGGHEWASDVYALTEAMSIVVAVQGGYTLPANFSWIDANGEEVPTNAAGIKALFLKISKEHYKNAHRRARLDRLTDAATTPEEIEAIPNW